MPKSAFLDSVRHRLRRLNYALRTEESYVSWIRQYIVFHQKASSGSTRQRGNGAILNLFGGGSVG